MMVCRVAMNAVQCTKAYEIETASWKVNPRFAKGMMHFEVVDGKPPPESMGAHALNFDH
jgi:hypothetical protein